MASKGSAIFFLSLLLFAFLSNACIPCTLPPPAVYPPKPKLPPPTPKAPPVNPFCPRDTLKLGVCADILGGLVGLVIGTPSKSKCCALLEGITDLEAAVCLCTALKANVLGINLNIPLSLSLLISSCEKKVPDGFKCV